MEASSPRPSFSTDNPFWATTITTHYSTTSTPLFPTPFSNTTTNYHRHPSRSSISTQQDSTLALEDCLSKLVLAVAHFRRAGPLYRHRSEAFWIFAAGSWGREEFERRVAAAGRKLAKQEGGGRGVEEDLRMGREFVKEAVGVLRRAEVRDVVDLLEARGAFEGGG